MIRVMSAALALCLLSSPAAFGHSVAAKQPSSLPAQSAAPLADLAVQNLAAVDGSTLSLTAEGRRLTREIITPGGAVKRLVFTPINSRMGTLSEDGSSPAGLFLIAGKRIALAYDDGRSESLSLESDGTVSITASAPEGVLTCSRWYPAGHHFTVAERRSALAEYARRLGMRPADYRPSQDGCAAPKLQPASFAPADAPSGKDVLGGIIGRMLALYSKKPAIAFSGLPAPVETSALFEKFYAGFLAAHEGGYVENDGNGSPANFGINQGANPDIDVASLSQADAKQILYQRYWLAAGADQLPENLAMVHGDTAVNLGVGTANQLLALSNGELETYLQLREARYRGIAAPDSDKARYLPIWLARNDDLRNFVGTPGTAEDRADYDRAPTSEDRGWSEDLPNF